MKTALAVRQWHLVDLQRTLPWAIFCKNNRIPPLRPLSSSPSSLQPFLHASLLVSPSSLTSTGWFTHPSLAVHLTFVCVFVFLPAGLHACVSLLHMCVCLCQRPQSHRDERGALGQPAGPGSRWTHTQRRFFSGPGAASGQTLPGLFLERGGDHPTGEWRRRPRMHQEGLQTVWR